MSGRPQGMLNSELNIRPLMYHATLVRRLNHMAWHKSVALAGQARMAMWDHKSLLCTIFIPPRKTHGGPAVWVMKCWTSVMRLFTGRACFTWISRTMWLRKYKRGSAWRQSQVRLSLQCVFFFFLPPPPPPPLFSVVCRKWEPNSCGMNEEEISEWQPTEGRPLQGRERERKKGGGKQERRESRAKALPLAWSAARAR